MSNFHGLHKRRNYFEGFYFKQQGKDGTLALIPAFHVNSAGRRSASLQVITGEGSYFIPFPAAGFSAKKDVLQVRVGKNIFEDKGLRLDLSAKGIELRGQLHFGPLKRPAYDIMGPYCLVPFLQCRHSLFSLYHRVDGEVVLNGRRMMFDGGAGYIEGDRGRSFPNSYLWTQCTWQNTCVMLSAADIPWPGGSFTGVIGTVYTGGREYRLATYLGAKPLCIERGFLVVQQGEYLLKARLIRQNPHPLHAPSLGEMSRTVRESPACRVQYKFLVRGKPVCEFISDRASFECAWGNTAPPIKGNR